MENDYKMKNIEIYPKENEDNIFRTEYAHQNVSNTPAFKNWQNSQLKTYGKNAKLFQCLNDCIYFYKTIKKDWKYDYNARCPLCNDYVCYFCSLNKKESYSECCLYQRLYVLFHSGKDNPAFVNGPLLAICDGLGCVSYESFCRTTLLYMIPVLNMIFIVGSVAFFFFYTQRCKYHDDIYFDHLYIPTRFLLAFIHFFFAIAVSVPFIFYNICIVLFIWIISIPFKLVPVRYCGNFVNEGYQ